MRPIVFLRMLTVVLILVMVGLIVRSSFSESLTAGLETIVGHWWGVTTLVDLYAGLAVIAAWIAVIERRVSRVVPWVIGLALLGNLATLVYAAQRVFRHGTVSEAFGLPARRSD